MGDVRNKPCMSHYPDFDHHCASKGQGCEYYESKKTFLIDITGVVIEEDEWDNTFIHISRNGDWCELPFSKEDIVETMEETDE